MPKYDQSCLKINGFSKKFKKMRKKHMWIQLPLKLEKRLR